MYRNNIKKIKATFIRTGNQINSAIGCLASLVNYFGGSVSMEDLAKNCGAMEGNFSLHRILETARIEGFRADGYEGDINFLKEFVQPVILPVEKKEGYDFCFLLYGWDNGKFIIGDPWWGIVEYREDELEAVWKSKAFLLIRPKKNAGKNN